jgi:hypothetical protein
MGVQIVAHEVPRGCCAARREQRFEEAHVVGFSARVADDALYLAGRDIERRDQALRAMTLVFILAPLDLAWLHRQAGCGTFQGLHAAHLIDRHRSGALFRRLGRLQVDRADVGTFRLERRIRLWREPASHAMWLKCGFF